MVNLAVALFRAMSLNNKEKIKDGEKYKFVGNITLIHLSALFVNSDEYIYLVQELLLVLFFSQCLTLL